MWRRPYHRRIYQIYILTSISECWQPNVHLISGQQLLYYTEITIRCIKSWMFCFYRRKQSNFRHSINNYGTGLRNKSPWGTMLNWVIWINMFIIMYNSVQRTQLRPNYIFSPMMGRWNNSLFPLYLNIITINISVKLD